MYKHMRRECTSLVIMYQGPWEFEICEDPECARVTARCTHPSAGNVWQQVREPDPDDDENTGQELVCSNCGRWVT